MTALKQLIVEVREKQPNWTSAQIGKSVGCTPSYVRVALRRMGMAFRDTTKSLVELRKERALLTKQLTRIDRKIKQQEAEFRKIPYAGKEDPWEPIGEPAKRVLEGLR